VTLIANDHPATLAELGPALMYDPFNPVSQERSRLAQGHGVRRSQRARKSVILATIRRILTEGGCDSVTVRRVAESSGYAVQTIYNLVGPRDEAITEAISEYSLFVGRTVSPQAEDPNALFNIIDSWTASAERMPEFCRQSNLIFFSNSRHIYYEFRDRQLNGLRNLLVRQRSSGVIRADIDTRDLAEQLTLLSSGLWLEWSDRPFPLEQLKRRLSAAWANLLSDKFTPKYQPLVAARLEQSAQKALS